MLKKIFITHRFKFGAAVLFLLATLILTFVGSVIGGLMGNRSQEAFAAEKKEADQGKKEKAEKAAGYRVGDRLSQTKPPATIPNTYAETPWEALVPKDWDPMAGLKNLNFGKLKDSDPQAMEALQKLKEVWDSAPVEASLRGQRIRIAGFMVPLEHKRDAVTEFLLVPYFGACIHTPPPPANQIIHVVASKPIKNAMSMDTVWVSGTLEVGHDTSPWGASGYKMKADIITPYVEPKK